MRAGLTDTHTHVVKPGVGSACKCALCCAQMSCKSPSAVALLLDGCRVGTGTAGTTSAGHASSSSRWSPRATAWGAASTADAWAARADAATHARPHATPTRRHAWLTAGLQATRPARTSRYAVHSSSVPGRHWCPAFSPVHVLAYLARHVQAAAASHWYSGWQYCLMCKHLPVLADTGAHTHMQALGRL